MARAPVPYDIGKVKKFWKDEPWDTVLPSEGFITDFVLHHRGIETPTSFALWTAVFVLSAVVRRAAWLKWIPPLYPNFYLILVAPPALCPKSTIINAGENLLYDYLEYIPEPRLKFEKKVRILGSKATPEGIFDVMLKSEADRWYNTETKVYEDIRGGEVVLAVSEFGTFLGRQKYNMGLVEKLTDLYDCKKHYTDTTISRGDLTVHNVYATLIGGTTREALTASLPPEAFGGGFMSRLVIVYQYAPTRMYPVPKNVPELPGAQDLARRLAWIARTVRGEYVLDPEAFAVYAEWYPKFKNKLLEDGEFERKTARWSRLGTNVLKLAMLIRAQRYEEGHTIGVRDFREAKAILDRTLAENEAATEDVGVGEFRKSYNHLREFLKANGSNSRMRRQVQQRMSRYGVNSRELYNLIMEMKEDGSLKIVRNGVEQERPSKDGKEVYVWLEDGGN